MDNVIQNLINHLMLFAAAFTTVMAILVGVTTLTMPGVAEGSVAIIVSRLVICLFIIAVGVVTWKQYRSGDNATTQWLLLFAAMALMTIGAFGFAWTIHLGEVTGDFEYWAMMINLALVGQGALSILHLWGRRHDPVRTT